MTPERLQVLLVVEDRQAAGWIRQALNGSPAGDTAAPGFELEEVIGLTDARQALDTTPFDAVLLDALLLDQEGRAELEQLQSLAAHTPLMVLEKQGSDQVTVVNFPEEAVFSLSATDGSPTLDWVVRHAIMTARTEARLLAHRDQQAAVSELGQLALVGEDLDLLMDRAVSLVTDLLEVPLCKVLELLPDGEAMLLRAGVGWNPGQVGKALVGAAHDSQAGYTLSSSGPVIVEDLRTETRFRAPDLLVEHHVVSGISVIIAGSSGPYGVLGAHDTRVRRFTPDHSHFLQSVANILGAASDHYRATQKLRESERRYRQLTEQASDGIFLSDLDGRYLQVNSQTCEMLGYSATELLKLSLAELIPEEDLRRDPLPFDRLGPGEVTLTERRLVHSDGSLIPVEISARRLPDGTVQGIIRDVRDRVRAETALRRELEEASLVQAVAAAGAEATSLTELLARATEIIGASLNPHNNGVLLLDTEMGGLVIHPTYRLQNGLDRQAAIPLGDGLTGQVAQTGQAVRLVDMRPEMASLALDARTRSVLCVPLKVGERVIGVINVESAQPGDFSEAEERLLSIIAGQLAVAIEKVRLFEAEKRQRALAETLGRVGMALNSTLELPELLNLICKESMAIFGIDAAYIWLLDGEDLVGFAGSGRRVEQFLGSHIPLSDEITLGARVVRERKAVYENDVPSSSRVNQELAALFGVQALMGVPLLDDGQAIGALMILATQPGRTFGSQDLATAEVLGNQAAIAIANASLFEQERRRRHEAEALRQAALDMTATLGLKELLDKILINLEQVVPYDSACIFLVEDDYLHAKAGRKLPKEGSAVGERFPMEDDPLFAEIRRRRRPLIYPDVRTEPDFKGWGGTDYVRGWMGVPLLARGGVIGILTLDSHQVGAYEEDHAVLAQALANQAAMAIDNARLLEASQRQARELMGLYDTALATSSVLVMEALLARLTDQINQLIAPDGFGVFLFDERSGEFEVAAAYEHGRDIRDLIGRRFSTQEGGLTGWVMRSRRTLLIQDIETETLPVEPRHVTQPARSWLGVPLISRDRLIGVINVQSFRPKAFSGSDRRFLESLAAQVAIALENARLYQAAQTGMARREALNAIVSAAAAATDLADLLEVALDRTLRALKLTSGGIWVREQVVLRGVSSRLEREVGRLTREGGVSLIQLKSSYAIDDWQRVSPDSPLAGFASTITSFGLQASLVVRITSNGQPIGGLALAEREPRSWTEEEIALAEAVGNQVGAAVERMRQFSRAKRHAELMDRLAPVSEALNRTLTVMEVFQEIGQGALALAGVDKVAVYVRQPDDTVSCPWSRGLSPHYLEVATTQATRLPGGQLLSRTEPVLIPDTIALPDESPLKNLAREEAYQAAGLWPLIYEGRVVAAVGCFYPEAHVWSQAEKEVMGSFARQAAVALANARLFETERRRTAALEALRKASLQVTSSLELSPVLEAILDQGLKLVSADDAHIFLYDGNRLEFGAAMWAGNRQQKPFSEPRRDGITYTVARTGERIVVPDVNQHPLFEGYQWGGAIVSLPLIKSNQVRGVMNVAFERPYSFSADELQVLELLADQAAIAIDNARLFQALEARVEELSVIAEASADLRGAGSVQEIGQMIADQTLKLVAADAAYLALVDEGGEWLLPIGSAGFPKDALDCEQPVGKGIPGQVLRDNQVSRIDDLSLDPLVACDELLAEMGPGICVPLRTSKNQVVGILLAARRKAVDGGRTPFGPDQERLLTTLAEIAGNALQRANTFEMLELAYLETVLSLARAMDARDSYTNDHSQRLAVWAEQVAQRMGCNEDQIQSILWAALLHDIGKIGVPDQILRKPGPLTEEEWEIMKRHPVTGAEIVAPVRSLADVAPLIRAHQERYDGTGYPDGLSGEAIPLGARILAVVDAYSAITDERVYRKARSHAEAVAELQRCAGSQFDSGVVDIFLEVIEQDRLAYPRTPPPTLRSLKTRTTGRLKLGDQSAPDAVS